MTMLIGCGKIDERQTFSTEEEMKSAVIGTYSGFNEKYGLHELRKITDDKVIILRKAFLFDEVEIKEDKGRSIRWNPQKGTFDSWGSTWEVLKTGELRVDKMIYQRINLEQESSEELEASAESVAETEE